MDKWKRIVEIALSEITSIKDLCDIAEIVIAKIKLHEWTLAEKVYEEQVEKELEELAHLKSWLING